jgi:hypothetical protein
MAATSLFDDLVSFETGVGVNPPPVDSLEDEQETEDPQEEETNEEEESSDSQEGKDLTEVDVFYNYLTSNNHLDPLENWDGKQETLEKALEDLPSKFFMEAAKTVNEQSYPLMEYMLALGEEATVDKMAEFFSKYIQPDSSVTEQDLQDEEKAYEYLKSKMVGTRLFPTEEKAIRHLDGLSEEEALIETAIQLFKDEDAAKKKQRDEDIKIKQQETIQARKREEEYAQSIVTKLEELPWEKSAKQKVLANLSPKNIDTINAQIWASPLAVIQLGSLYSFFDPKTGAFDLKAFATQANTAQVEKEKATTKKDSLSSQLSKMGKRTPETSGGTSFWSDFKKG